MSVFELDPGYRMSTASHGDKVVLIDGERWDLEADWRAILRPWLHKPAGRSVAGIDVGWSIDPIEIVLDEITAKSHRWTTRLSLHGFDDSLKQMRLVCALDRPLRPSEGWGLDATGAGTHLENSLKAEADRWHRFDERLSGFVMQKLTDERELPTGRLVKDAESKSRDASATRSWERGSSSAGCIYRPSNIRRTATCWWSSRATRQRRGRWAARLQHHA